MKLFADENIAAQIVDQLRQLGTMFFTRLKRDCLPKMLSRKKHFEKVSIGISAWKVPKRSS